MMSDSKRFSDFAEEEKPVDGDKVKIESILNKEIRVTDYKVKKSQYAKNNSEQYLTVQFEVDGTKKIFFTGSCVLLDQLEKYGHEMPFLTTVKKVDRYYTFS